MANMLDGIQYRVPIGASFYANTNTFPSWNDAKWDAWKDCESATVYSANTQFRVKPIYDYIVSNGGRDLLTTSDKDKAMSRLAQLVEEGRDVTLLKKERQMQTVPEILAARKVQFRYESENTWRNGTYFAEAGTYRKTYFRLRPDSYWEVTVSSGIANSTIQFEDPTDLSNYLQKYATTNNTSALTVKPVKYVS